MFCGRDGKTLQSINETGVYEVRLFKNGQDQLVRIDDYIPCRIGDGPIYARAKGMQCLYETQNFELNPITFKGAELWVMLVEKAFAKCCGSYVALEGGWEHEVGIGQNIASIPSLISSRRR